MKIYILISVLVLFILDSFSQSKKYNQDTTFIVKQNEEGDYHAVFIEHNHNSKFYQQLKNFNLCDEDLWSMRSALIEYKQKNNIKYNKYTKFME